MLWDERDEIGTATFDLKMLFHPLFYTFIADCTIPCNALLLGAGPVYPSIDAHPSPFLQAPSSLNLFHVYCPRGCQRSGRDTHILTLRAHPRTINYPFLFNSRSLEICYVEPRDSGWKGSPPRTQPSRLVANL